MTNTLIPWGPTGELVYKRTYSRTKPDGTRETWPETVERVVDGNLNLVDASYQWTDERERLIERMTRFEIIPAGRHLWASGVRGRQYLFNCHVSGWDEDITTHFAFTFLRLMEGGGVGANYSNHFLGRYQLIKNAPTIHVVCDEAHPDYPTMRDAGMLSAEFDPDWPGAIEVEDSREGWAEALTELIRDHYRVTQHPDRVFDVSRVRAEGARLKAFGGHASGPLPLAEMLHEVARILGESHGMTLDGMSAMAIDHAIAQCVVSGGNRRSARMSIMHWDDPQVFEFLRCKQDSGDHWTTNISVEVDGNFWTALVREESHAAAVFQSIAQGMLANGEPGFWDSGLSNVGEPNPVIATNPCGEIALESWENCNLGHVNLSAFVAADGHVDHEGMAEAHVLMTRFLIRATYGDVNDEKQADVLARNRRIGVGHLGFASFIAKLGIRYSEAADTTRVQWILEEHANIVDMVSRDYAHQLRIPAPVKSRTVAPTGTIAKMPGVSEGIHPIFARYFLRRIRFSAIDADQIETVNEYAAQGYRVEPCYYAPHTWVVEIPTKDTLLEEVEAIFGTTAAESIVESAGELSLDAMLSVQALYQCYWADNAVSYTANVDPERYSVSELMDHLTDYWGKVKGFTIFPEMGMPQSPYERISRVQYEQYAATAVADSVDEECMSGACPVR